MAESKTWMNATRPKTLAASMIPVAVGASVAYYDGHSNIGITAIVLICALLIQIITNFINEIYDFRRGADTKERLGPERAVAVGKISPKAMRNASLMLVLITFCLGMILVNYSDWQILLVGILSLIFAWAYTGGPYPIAYNGLSEIFVFIFFGMIATAGTYYVLCSEWSSVSLLAAVVPGLLSMNILGVNNYRDIDTDPKAGKLTLAVRIGRRNARLLYQSANIISVIIPLALYIITGLSLMLLPIITLPLAIKLNREIARLRGAELNRVLAGTGKFLMAHGLLTCIGFIISH